jgi:hypothetical protein
VARIDIRRIVRELEEQRSQIDRAIEALEAVEELRTRHFGLGKVSTADIDVYWPTGAKETFTGVAADQLVTIREGQRIVKSRPFR